MGSEMCIRDRYYTKAQVDLAIAAGGTTRTDTYSITALQNQQPGTGPQFLPVGGWCTTNSQPWLGTSFSVPLTLPVGVHIDSIDVATYTGTATPVMTVKLEKSTIGTATADHSIVVTADSVSAPAAIHHIVLTPSAEVVDANENFYVGIYNLTSAANNGFCGLTVTYGVT